MNATNPLRRARSFLSRFGAARRGATAVEFAFVALPFLTLLFAVLELGMVFLVSTTLQNAADAAGRRIRTGELQAEGGTRATFKSAICGDMAWLGSDCATNLTVDVQTYDNFDDLMVVDPVTGARTLRGPTISNGAVQEGAWAPGGAEDIVLVRAYYSWTLFTPLLNSGLPNLGNSKRLISTTVTFRNEPWGSGS